MNDVAITDADRYPTLSPAGAAMLRFMREHPSAPIYRNQSGNRLTHDDIAALRVFDADVQAGGADWSPGTLPAWLDAFVERAWRDVPFYRRYGARPARFADIPTTTRADLSRDVAQFVPDAAPLERLINFATTGTTGQPILIASHPAVAASYLPYFKKALARVGVTLTHGRGQVGVVLVGWQRTCFTYVSVTPMMDESGLAKINLHPNDWRDPDDRVTYIDALDAEVYTGDPISFGELAKLPLRTRPKALISTSMALLPGMRSHLKDRFGCPVLDVYSMNESGPIAVAEGDTHVLLQHRLYVEIVGADGEPVAAGERGEVALTGGFNPYLPLLRYRTGDQAAMAYGPDGPVLKGLEGRPPTLYVTADGETINNIDVTHALKQFPIPQFTLHQRADGSLRLRLVAGYASLDEVRKALLGLFGHGQVLVIEPVPAFDGKVVQYTRD